MKTKSRKRKIENIKRQTQSLSSALEKILNSKKFPAEIFAYNPLEYAQNSFFEYIDRYANFSLEGLFLGMNPGPNGMMQSGIPFGDIALVKDYLKISDGVKKPRKEHPKKPIQGFDWPRSEVSGTRLWTFFRSCHSEAEDFFKKFFVLNYCPLGFLGPSGANLTPDKLPIELRKSIEAECDKYLLEIVPLFESSHLIGVGGYASKVFSRLFPDAKIKTILHPSPASPAANRGWARIVSEQLQTEGISLSPVPI